MRKITITDGVNTVTLLSDLEFTWTPKIIGEPAGCPLPILRC